MNATAERSKFCWSPTCALTNLSLGKLAALWNAREMLLMPLVMIMGMALLGSVPTLTLENVLYLSIAFLVLNIFAVTLGIHAGLTYQNSRTAIANSLGTMFFLFIGIFIFMLLLVEARSSFAIQLQSFILFIGFGSLGLYSSLTHRNPSGALTLASVMLPFLTFYAITDFLLGVIWVSASGSAWPTVSPLWP